MGVSRPTTARDLDALSLDLPCPTLDRVTEGGVQSHREQSFYRRPCQPGHRVLTGYYNYILLLLSLPR
jgi:hypothetical protein